MMWGDPFEKITIQIRPWIARKLDEKTRELGREAVDAELERLIVQELDKAERSTAAAHDK